MVSSACSYAGGPSLSLVGGPRTWPDPGILEFSLSESESGVEDLALGEGKVGAAAAANAD